MGDRIIYKRVSKGGGIDGLDYTDKGGKVLDAGFVKAVIEYKLDGWSELKTEVVDVDAVAKHAIAKLSPVEVACIMAASRTR